MAYNTELRLNGIGFPHCCREYKPPKRQVGCHAKGGDYITAKAKHEADKAQIRKQRNTEKDADSTVFVLKRN